MKFAAACFLYFLTLSALPVIAQEREMSTQQYVETYSDIAIRKMQAHGIPASITLAQGILESASGNSELAINANNHFGIKCHKEWKGMTYYKDDETRNECFRRYASAEESFEDHSLFLTTRDRYAFLFRLDPMDYKAWAEGLQKAGYATNPQYASLLIRTIEENSLDSYDRAAVSFARKQENTAAGGKHGRSLKRHGSGEEWVSGIRDRKILKNNRIKYIVAEAGDHVDLICRDLDLMPWQIRKYNDLGRTGKIEPGQLVYLQPKRCRAEKDFHQAAKGETMYMLSQIYGVRVKRLYKMNRMDFGTEPVPGQKIWLRKKKPLS